MANARLEINASRDIARQILHRRFSFQEFSRRYQDVSALPECVLCKARRQDMVSRQNSDATDDPYLDNYWRNAQRYVYDVALQQCREALRTGLAKEQARALRSECFMPPLYGRHAAQPGVYLKQRQDPSPQ